MTRIPSKEAPRRISSWLIRDLEAVTAELIILICHGMTNSESIASDSCPTMHPQKRPINFFLSTLLYRGPSLEKSAPPPVACLPFQPLPFPRSIEGDSPKGCGHDANGPENCFDLVSLRRLRTKKLHLKEVQNCIWSIPRGSKPDFFSPQKGNFHPTQILILAQKSRKQVNLS